MAVMRAVNKENPRQKKQFLPSTKWKIAFGISALLNIGLIIKILCL